MYVIVWMHKITELRTLILVKSVYAHVYYMPRTKISQD